MRSTAPCACTNSARRPIPQGAPMKCLLFNVASLGAPRMSPEPRRPNRTAAGIARRGPSRAAGAARQYTQSTTRVADRASRHRASHATEPRDVSAPTRSPAPSGGRPQQHRTTNRGAEVRIPRNLPITRRQSSTALVGAPFKDHRRPPVVPLLDPSTRRARSHRRSHRPTRDLRFSSALRSADRPAPRPALGQPHQQPVLGWTR
jgi:hypothetical protein